MADVSKAVGEDYRGIAMPDPRWQSSTFVRADSSITEAGARPGVVVASQRSGMVLESSGSMPDITGLIPALVLTANKGGMPGVQDARFTWEANYANPAGYQTRMGWDSPNSISRYEKITKYGSGATHLGGCLRLRNNAVLLTYTDTNGSTIRACVQRKSFDAAGHAASGAVSWAWDAGQSVVSSLTTKDIAVVPATTCALQLPEGRVQMYWIAKSIAVSAFQYYQLWMSVSDDNGATWSAPQKASLRETIRSDGSPGATAEGFEITRARVAYSGGQVLLILAGTAHNTNSDCVNTIWQYASADLGNSFTRVNIENPAVGGTASQEGGYVVGDLPAAGEGFGGGAAPDIAVGTDGAFVVSYIAVGRPGATAAFSGKPATKRLGTAFTAWTTAASIYLTDSAFPTYTGSLQSNIWTGTNSHVACDETGVLSLCWQTDSRAGTLIGESAQALSFDDALTWLPQHATYTDTNPSDAGKSWPWWESGDVGSYPTDQCSTFQCGRLLVFALGATGDEQEGVTVLRTASIMEIDLGGYTTATRPFKYPEEADSNMVISEVNWLPIDRIRDVTGWTFAGLGTETLTTLDYTTLTTAGGQTINLSNTTMGAVTSGQHRTWAMFENLVTSGTTRFEVRVGDGANVLELAFEFSTTQFQVYDIGAAAAIYGPSAATNPGGWNQVLLCLDYSTRTVSVWSRLSTADYEVRQWKRLLTSAAVTAVASANTNRIMVNQTASSGSRWKEIHFGAGASGFPIDTDATWPRDNLYGRAFSPYPVHVYSGEGVKVRAVDGPTWDGDVFTITQRHEYGIENVFADVSPSPRKTWRSTDLTAQSIVCQLDFSGDPTPLLGRVLVVGAFGCNFDDLTIQYRTTSGGGAWTALGVLSMRSGQTALRWIRDGKMVRPDTAASANHAIDYFTFNTLEGSHVAIKDQGGNLVSRKVNANSEGIWANTAAAVRTRIYSDDILTTDQASGTDGEIWSKDGVLILRDCPDICELRFLIAAAPHADYIVEGYYEIGSLFVGHLAYFGMQYARGRAFTMSPNAAVTTGRGGARRSQVYGPARRSVEFNWANENEHDASSLVGLTGGAQPAPDYILTATGSTEPAATPADTGYKMQGLVEALRGAATPCIYLPRVPMVSAESGDTTLVNRNTFMLGRIVTEPRVETVLGSEWSNGGELARIATVTFEEEV